MGVQHIFVVNGKKKCSSCREIKPVSEFHQRSDHANGVGYRSICKECTKPKERNRHLERSYGIDLFDYERMYKEQGGKCAICYKPYKVLDVDHDHESSGKNSVRGLLCKRCNAYLDRIGKSVEYSERVIQYLKGRR